MNAATLTKLNNVLFCLIALSFNGYLKTVIDFKIGSDSCHPKYQYAKSRSLKFNSQRLIGVGGGEDVCDYAAI